MRGELTLSEDLIIEGDFDGTIVNEGEDAVLVRRVARVSGKISAHDLVVEDGTNLENTILSGHIRLADERTLGIGRQAVTFSTTTLIRRSEEEREGSEVDEYFRKVDFPRTKPRQADS